MELSALLQGEGGVRVKETKTITTEPLLSLAPLAVPVLVTTETYIALLDTGQWIL